MEMEFPGFTLRRPLLGCLHSQAGRQQRRMPAEHTGWLPREEGLMVKGSPAHSSFRHWGKSKVRRARHEALTHHSLGEN